MLVRSYRTVSPLPPRTVAVCFLWHCPASDLGLPLAITLLCEVRTFLERYRYHPRPPGQLARSMNVLPEAPIPRASLDCAENSLPGGPTSAFYELFANPDALADQFQTDVSAKHPHPLPCPEGQPLPGSWHDDSSPNTTAGSKVPTL